MSSISRLTLVVTFLVAIILLTVLLPAGSLAIQDQDRIINYQSFSNEPVEITAVKAKKGVVKMGEKFADDNDWWKNFTVTVHNNSGKTITSLSIDVTFVRPQSHATSQEPPFFHTLHFGPSPFFPEYALRDRGKVVKPDGIIDLVLLDENYEHIERFLRELKYPASIKKVELLIHTVGFEDGTAWSGGTWFYRDPNKPDELIPEERSPGRARNRSAFFWL